MVTARPDQALNPQQSTSHATQNTAAGTTEGQQESPQQSTSHTTQNTATGAVEGRQEPSQQPTSHTTDRSTQIAAEEVAEIQREPPLPPPRHHNTATMANAPFNFEELARALMTEYVAAAKELRVHQQILLHLADRRLRSYLRTAPTPPPSPKRSAPASTSQLTTQPAETSGTPPPAWRLIRLDTPPPPRTPRLDPRFNGVDPRRFRAPLDGAQTPPLPQEIERELRRQATHVSWPCSWRSTHSQEAEGPISSE
uniref:Uncharacterized protein n=1 Tax=Trichogramma kaykai TaxID=54128 RepID=A0ABD2XQJ1_9HYME